MIHGLCLGSMFGLRSEWFGLESYCREHFSLTKPRFVPLKKN
jgi:hypothetical protein